MRELKLLKKLKKGDQNSFKKIFELYHSSLYNFAMSYLKSNEAAEDIVQEVFIKLWDKRKEINLNKSFQNYLFTITLNAVRKHFNILSKTQELKHDILIVFSTNKETFDDQDNYQILLNKLDELIQQMPEKRKQVFIKKKLEGKSLNEISEEFNISTKTVEYHITEAMKYLKEGFKNN